MAGTFAAGNAGAFGDPRRQQASGATMHVPAVQVPGPASVVEPAPARVELPPVVRPNQTVDDTVLSAPARTQRQMTWDAFKSHRLAFGSLCVLLTIVALCIFLPLVLVDPTAIDYGLLRATPPSAAHPLGTDSLGRDVLARLTTAGRTSLMIGFSVAIFTALIGSVVGVVSGYFGGKTDGFLMWIVSVLMTIPTLPLLIAIAVLVANPSSKLGFIFGQLPQVARIILVFVTLGWLGISRVVRSQVMALRDQEFCEAARALGASHRRIMFMHILPNTISVIAVFTTLAVSGAIIGESALSFLGFGVQPPDATWGNMLNEARDLYTILSYWWLTWFPALAICITVLCVNFIGDGVRDATDPKSMKK